VRRWQRTSIKSFPDWRLLLISGDCVRAMAARWQMPIVGVRLRGGVWGWGTGNSSCAVRLSVVCDWRHLASFTEGIAMSKNRTFLVKESVELLRQVRADIANNLSNSWVVEIDEVIVRLELYLNEGVDDPGRINDILNVLARGLGMILALHRFFD
jgi:hypothetical protein